MTRRRGVWLAALLALVAGLAVAAASGLRADRGEARDKSALLLFTTLPIFWNEADDVSAMLRPGEPPWPRRALERRHRLVPIDAIDPAALAQASGLLVAQPRPLAPGENVALDNWVAGGGRLVLFADPMLTGESSFAVGDRRRPQDVVLLSPILARWGLRLEFDESQPAGEREVRSGDSVFTVRLAGSFAPVPGGRRDARCTVERSGVVAQCRVGRGAVIAIADAALLEPARSGEDEARRARALDSLVARGLD